MTSETIHTTANHPWLTTDRGWVHAGDLRPGEPVVTLPGQAGSASATTATVAWVRVVPGAAEMDNLTVAQDHTYAVGASRVVAHNCTPVVGDPSAIGNEGDNNTYFHYTNEEGYKAIMRDDEAVLAALGGKLHVTKEIYSPAEAEQNLFIGDPKYRGKGDYVIAFQAPEGGAEFGPGTQGNELIGRYTVRVPRSNILYAGPNPF